MRVPLPTIYDIYRLQTCMLISSTEKFSSFHRTRKLFFVVLESSSLHQGKMGNQSAVFCDWRISFIKSWASSGRSSHKEHACATGFGLLWEQASPVSRISNFVCFLLLVVVPKSRRCHSCFEVKVEIPQLL